MSFHHHGNHHHHHQNPHSSSCCCCNTCNRRNYNCCSSNSNSTNSQTQISDELLQTLTAHVLIQPQQPQIILKPDSHFNNYRHHHHHHHSQPIKDDQQRHLIQCLLRRVAALESSLSNLSFSRLETRQRVSSQKHSIKHLAAVTIQRHFRQFLARRSRILRDLKLLASIKSQAASLRSLVSKKSLKNPRAVSKEAMDLLFQLDSIQSSDAMIREGKRSISKELVRMSEFIDKVLIREREDEVDVLVRRRERGKRVSFAENGDEGKLFGDLLERSSDEEEEETHLRNQGFYDRFSDGEESPKDMRSGVIRGSGLAAPLPVTMEPRRNGSTKKVVIEED